MKVIITKYILQAGHAQYNFEGYDEAATTATLIARNNPGMAVAVITTHTENMTYNEPQKLEG